MSEWRYDPDPDATFTDGDIARARAVEPVVSPSLLAAVSSWAAREDESWRNDAACLNSDMAVFFPTPGYGNHVDWNPARRVCRSCPVVSECRDYAIEHGHWDGMWGGLTPDERAELRGVH